jgi:hypothetical protein
MIAMKLRRKKMLKLVKNPKFAKRVEYTREQKAEAFEEFYQLANKYYKLKQCGRKKEDIEELHWKDVLIAIINKEDFNRYADAVSYYCGSPLEHEENITSKKIKVYASGYWCCIGS